MTYTPLQTKENRKDFFFFPGEEKELFIAIDPFGENDSLRMVVSSRLTMSELIWEAVQQGSNAGYVKMIIPNYIGRLEILGFKYQLQLQAEGSDLWVTKARGTLMPRNIAFTGLRPVP